MATPFIGVIGGSGLYAMDSFEVLEERRMTTPFGDPSDKLMVGRLAGCDVAFLPRHGRGHRLSPSELPYRANIHAMKQLGVSCLVSVSAVGSLKETLPPGAMVVIDQFIDRTVARPRSFFGDGCVAHVSMADPTCPVLARLVAAAAQRAGVGVQMGGTYVVIEGPQFSTRAESELFRSWGVDVIGMTNLPEARLAREAELPYATLALVTDYDCWHRSEEDVTVEVVMRTLGDAVRRAQLTLAALAADAAERGLDLSGSPALGALSNAVMTPWTLVPEETKLRLSLLLGK